MTITNEDNMAMMARYPDNYFDLAIVDPPYGIERFKKQTKSKNRVENFFNTGIWNNNVPTKEYFNELFRVSKNQIIWGFNHLSELIPKTSGFIFWNKHQNGNFSEGELAWSSIGNGKYYDRPYQKDIGNKIHPTQKPYQLYEWLLINYAKEGDKILDTHLGSGSIALACHKLKYNLTACELDTKHYNDAMERIEQHKKQLTLF
jgi:site-specific DNA-methyltransferase (adenine-specific)